MIQFEEKLGFLEVPLKDFTLAYGKIDVVGFYLYSKYTKNIIGIPEKLIDDKNNFTFKHFSQLPMDKNQEELFYLKEGVLLNYLESKSPINTTANMIASLTKKESDSAISWLREITNDSPRIERLIAGLSENFDNNIETKIVASIKGRVDEDSLKHKLKETRQLASPDRKSVV